MRATTLLKMLFGIKKILVTGFSIYNGALLVDVRPAWRRARCAYCDCRLPGYDSLGPRLWRHLDFGGVMVFFRCEPKRVNCPEHGVVVERVPWNDDPAARFTQDFEEQVAFMAQYSDKTMISQQYRIAWATVGSIIARVVKRKRPEDPLEGLVEIGVDEVSYRKQHHYVTLVTDHRTRRIVWGAEGKSSETLKSFFAALGEEGRARIKVVTMDMSAAFIKAVQEAVPHADIVFDRFHVQQLVSKALDETRREECCRARETGNEEAAQGLKKTRFSLLKNQWNLTRREQERLSALPKSNQRLYRGYLLKESFVNIFDWSGPEAAKKELHEWLAWAARSRLPAFVGVAKTIRKHFDEILAYVRLGLSNGVVEGLNNKVRLLTRRAYGFHSADAVLAMIMLCCTDINLQPVLKIL